MVKEDYIDLFIKFEKHIGKKKLREIPEEFINEENNNIIIHPIETLTSENAVCNYVPKCAQVYA